MVPTEPHAENEGRVKALTEFRTSILRWFDGRYEPEGKEALRSYINRNTIAAQTAVNDVGCLKRLTVGPPPAVGGLVIKDANPFDMLFQSLGGISVIPGTADMIDQAIGVYQHLDLNTGLVRVFRREVVDIETAIERALRPHFHSTPPSSERHVQDAVETILRAVGVTFHREQESAPVGPRAFKPDFTFPELDLALEIKLAREGHGSSPLQEEITADIAAYRTKWRHLLFVVYDLGVIIDPSGLRRDNMKLFGVSVLMVKH